MNTFTLIRSFCIINHINIIHRGRYALRNKENLIPILARANYYKNSFIPSTTKLWNNLPLHIRSITDITSFKTELFSSLPRPNTLFFYGCRKYQIIHARLRMNCSILKGHLCKMKIINDSKCTCGHTPEDSYHYFFTCSLYTQARTLLQNTVFNITALNLNTLLYGNDRLPIENNLEIFNAVFNYIEDSGRFSNS